MLLLVNVITVYADDVAPPGPFYIVSEDGSRVFHVTPYWGCIDMFAGYPKTGLYYNTTPPELIYLVENLCYIMWEVDFFFSDDMRYFAWAPQTNMIRTSVYNATAIAFFKDGKLLREYKVADLIRHIASVPQSTTMAMWVNLSSIRFNSADNQLTLTTVERMRYIFDITTGEIISSNRTMYPFVVIAVVFLLMWGVGIVIVKYKLSEFQTATSPKSSH